MKRIVFYSGGVASWWAAKRVVDAHGNDGVTLLFTDTLIEDADLYRFLHEGAAHLGLEVTAIADGRTPWEVFRDVRIIGNSRIDPCSRILKRDLARKWVHDNSEPETTTLYVGIDWTEIHRLPRIQKAWEPYRVEAPMTERPLVSKGDMLDGLRALGIEPPRLYSLGYPHNNCGGFCIKAGHAQFRLLLRTQPDLYAHHEAKEQEMREYLDADVSVLRDRSGGDTTPLTLREFRERVESGQEMDLFEWGGCGCFTDSAAGGGEGE